MAEDDSSRFWTFSRSVYAEPGVEAACLALQDESGGDVGLALYCLFAGAVLGIELTRERLATLERETAPWRAAVIEPLRRVRRHLARTGPDSGLRAAVLAAEIEAERLGLARLVAASDGTGRGAAGPGLAAGNLERYAGAAGRRLFEAAALRLAAGLAPAPDRAGIEAEQVQDPAERVVDHLVQAGRPGI
jgi:uncharacterized protein (TIGR02444 family)